MAREQKWETVTAEVMDRWMNECCEPRADYEASSRDLWTSWQTWRQTAERVPHSVVTTHRDLILRLLALGYERGRWQGRRMLRGIRLRERGTPRPKIVTGDDNLRSSIYYPQHPQGAKPTPMI